MFQLGSEDRENLKCRIGISSAIGMFLPKANFKDIVARILRQEVEAFKFDEAAREDIPIAESSEDALAVLDCGIFCAFHKSPRVGACRPAVSTHPGFRFAAGERNSRQTESETASGA